MPTEEERNDARQAAAMLEGPRWEFQPPKPEARFLGRKGNYDLWYAGSERAPGNGDEPARGNTDARVPIFVVVQRSGALCSAWSRSARDRLKRLVEPFSDLPTRNVLRTSAPKVVTRASYIVVELSAKAALEEARRRYFRA